MKLRPVRALVPYRTLFATFIAISHVQHAFSLSLSLSPNLSLCIDKSNIEILQNL